MSTITYKKKKKTMEEWDRLVLSRLEALLDMSNEQLKEVSVNDEHFGEVFEYHEGVNDAYFAFVEVMDKKYNFKKEVK